MKIIDKVYLWYKFSYKSFLININLVKIYLPSILYLQNATNLAVPLVSHGELIYDLVSLLQISFLRVSETVAAITVDLFPTFLTRLLTQTNFLVIWHNRTLIGSKITNESIYFSLRALMESKSVVLYWR